MYVLNLYFMFTICFIKHAYIYKHRALKRDVTRLGKRTNRGAWDDGINSVMRYYINNYVDVDRQAGLDVVLGENLDNDTCMENYNRIDEFTKLSDKKNEIKTNVNKFISKKWTKVHVSKHIKTNRKFRRHNNIDLLDYENDFNVSLDKLIDNFIAASQTYL